MLLTEDRVFYLKPELDVVCVRKDWGERVEMDSHNALYCTYIHPHVKQFGLIMSIRNSALTQGESLARRWRYWTFNVVTIWNMNDLTCEQGWEKRGRLLMVRGEIYIQNPETCTLRYGVFSFIVNSFVWCWVFGPSWLGFAFCKMRVTLCRSRRALGSSAGQVAGKG